MGIEYCIQLFVLKYQIFEFTYLNIRIYLNICHCMIWRLYLASNILPKFDKSYIEQNTFINGHNHCRKWVEWGDSKTNSKLKEFLQSLILYLKRNCYALYNAISVCMSVADIRFNLNPLFYFLFQVYPYATSECYSLHTLNWH